LLARAIKLLRWFAILALVAMMLITIVDVALRVTIGELLLGSVELVELALVAVVFLALPETLLRDSQIVVDAIDLAVAPRMLRLVRAVASLVTLLLVGVVAWRMVLPALDTLEIGDRTSDLQVSLFWYWLPMIVGGVAATAAAAYVAWRHLTSPPPASSAPIPNRMEPAE
jgi:TRAP-type transport system small permease protein